MKRIREVMLELAVLVVLGLAATLAMPRAYAGMISSDAAQQPADDRAGVKAMLQRPEVVKEMQKTGIAPEQAAARVDAMTDTEVSQLAGRLAALPAGGTLSNEELLLVVVIVLLVAILL